MPRKKEPQPVSDGRTWGNPKFANYVNVALPDEVTPEALQEWAAASGLTMGTIIGGMYADAYKLGIKQNNLDAELAEVTMMDMDEESPVAGCILTCSANNIELAFIGLWYKHSVLLLFDWRTAETARKPKRKMM